MVWLTFSARPEGSRTASVVPTPPTALLAAIQAQDVPALNDALNNPQLKEAEIRSRVSDAIATGSAPLVQCLLDRLPRKQKTDPALNMVLHYGHGHLLEMVLPYCSPKSYGSQPLRLAAEHGNVEAVKRLLPLSNPKAQNSDALRWAAAKGHLAIVQLLAPVSDVTAQNDAALRHASAHGHHDVARFLWPLSTTAATIPHLIKKKRWKALDALAPLLPPSEQAALREWLDQAPKNALPLTEGRWQAYTRLHTTLAAGPEAATGRARRRS